MRMVSKISVLILLAVIVIQLNAFPVPSYSYSITRQGQLQIGLGVFSGIEIFDKINQYKFYQLYIKYGLPFGFDLCFGSHFRPDVVSQLSSSSSDPSRSFISIGKGFSLNSGMFEKITARISYGFGSQDQKDITVALDGKIQAVNLSTGYSCYYTVYPSIYSANCVFMRFEMKSPDRLFNVNPYLLMQYEYGYSGWDFSHQAVVVGGGFSLYFNLLERGEE